MLQLFLSRSHPRFWSSYFEPRFGTGLETVIAAALHRAPASQSALLAWPLACGSSVADRTRALDFSGTAFCESRWLTLDGVVNSPTWRRAMSLRSTDIPLPR
jgi:hypothetical protein